MGHGGTGWVIEARVGACVKTGFSAGEGGISRGWERGLPVLSTVFLVEFRLHFAVSHRNQDRNTSVVICFGLTAVVNQLPIHGYFLQSCALVN